VIVTLLTKLIILLVTIITLVLDLMFVFLDNAEVLIHSHVPVMFVTEENVLMIMVLLLVETPLPKKLVVLLLVAVTSSVLKEHVHLLSTETVMLEIPMSVPEESAVPMVPALKKMSMDLVKMVIHVPIMLA